MADGFCKVLVFPFPKSQFQLTAPVELSVNLTESGVQPLSGETLKSA